ncbi:3'-5' exonuclease [Rubellicoccus peritrichatus]|uniref:3'-5' exonuclease n=1 Tax=Rubellicoccus peritrichatus TaxID=3080537 RepID=A0AAQ3LBV8_9BACT|nr:3'-5' exonuclease [Puniceicoccus sp. CR14]WOO43244.1 3'-5' exonuclease [Puniceicoccus sp. CR14]
MEKDNTQTNIQESDAEPEEALPGIPKRISKDEINQLPLARFNGRVHIITTPDSADIAVSRLSQSSVLGFDTESRPSFKKGDNYPPSIVQFAGNEEAFIFQLDRLGGLGCIRPLLQSRDITKVGVALHDDVKRLKEIEDFEADGFAEINVLSKKIGVANTGLRSLVALFLSKRVSKGAQISNWAKKNLTQNQISYAATDAWISRELYLKLHDVAIEHKLLDSKNGDSP